MVLTADDEDVSVVCSLEVALEPDIVIGLRGVPIECGRNRISRYPDTHNIGGVSGLLRVNDEAIIDWTVRGDND
jgi:hypothetical protein